MTTPSPSSVDTEFAQVEASPAFRILVRSRRRFVTVALTAGLGWFTLFLVLVAWLPGSLGSSVFRGLTLAYVLGLSQFVLVGVITWAYLRRAARLFDPLEAAAVGQTAMVTR
ncbi:DUF485 domain-containing protein [Amycolatopsis sp. NPDC051903]|uniref:DUF485 domain-containing protein n=1 Tax=Amycolatopsis sp. NPDC051903 TaxID=3363936 RepID=UPI003799B66C